MLCVVDDDVNKDIWSLFQCEKSHWVSWKQNQNPLKNEVNETFFSLLTRLKLNSCFGLQTCLLKNLKLDDSDLPTLSYAIEWTSRFSYVATMSKRQNLFIKPVLPSSWTTLNIKLLFCWITIFFFGLILILFFKLEIIIWLIIIHLYYPVVLWSKNLLSWLID